MFDCIVVGLQVMERIVYFLEMDVDSTYFRMMRILRIVRIVRLVRIVRIIEELHTITSSIVMSLMSLFWTLFLLFITMYIFSVLFAQTIINHADAWENRAIRYWFGGLARTILTMFEVITGGVSWDEVAYPIIEHVSPFMGLVLLLYITFCVFAMLNMATGVFVEAAVRKTKEDGEVFAANHISDIFFGEGDVKEVDWEMFQEKLGHRDMQNYFKSINVDPSEAQGLFKLIDVDNGGTIDADELINGLLRLRGGAKALELSMLTYEVFQMNKITLRYQKNMEFAMGTMLNVVGALTNTVKFSAELVEDIGLGQEIMFNAHNSVSSQVSCSEISRLKQHNFPASGT